MAKLFVLISDGCDGSYYPRYTMNEEWIKTQEQRDDFNYDGSDIGVDGDGFHYSTLTVTDGTTLQDLGITYDCSKDN